MAHFIVGGIDSVVAQQETFIPERPVATAGTGTHFTLGGDGKTEAVTNEDYVGALVRFENGVRGTLEACRVINGPKCEMAFEVNGTAGALRWNFEQMNELEVYLPAEDGFPDGYTRILSGPNHPFHSDFNTRSRCRIRIRRSKDNRGTSVPASHPYRKTREPKFPRSRRGRRCADCHPNLMGGRPLGFYLTTKQTLYYAKKLVSVHKIRKVRKSV